MCERKPRPELHVEIGAERLKIRHFDIQYHKKRRQFVIVRRDGHGLDRQCTRLFLKEMGIKERLEMDPSLSYIVFGTLHEYAIKLQSLDVIGVAFCFRTLYINNIVTQKWILWYIGKGLGFLCMITHCCRTKDNRFTEKTNEILKEPLYRDILCPIFTKISQAIFY